jgi:hypothetical protein
MLERGPVQRTFFVERGFLYSEASSLSTEHLSQVLANLKLLDATRSAHAFAEAEQRQVPFGQYLLDQGHVDATRLQDALEHKAKQAFFDCYCWESGAFEFAPGERREGRGVPLKLSLALLHREAMTRPQASKTLGGALVEAQGYGRLLDQAHGHFAAGDYHAAAQLASQVLELAPVPEAHTLYRNAASCVTESIADEVATWTGIKIHSLSHPLPAGVTADEIYLHARLGSGQPIVDLLHSAPMGPLAAYRALQRLLKAGALEVEPKGQDAGAVLRPAWL